MEAIPILAVTPPLARKDRIALLSLGADDCIDLPFEPMELRAKVLALARRHGVRISIGMMRLELDKALADLHTYRADLKRLMDRIVEALEHLNLANDTDTGNHIHRVSEYARLLAETQGCPKNFVEQIHQYAGLHDVGKVGIRDAILKKPGAFTPQEWAEMKTHTLVGSRILERAGFSRTACNIAAYHHERWDGDGYPEGRKGVHIPLEARIVAVADSYDAGRNKRCYKDASGHEALRQDMLAKTGTQYDPELVEVFFSREEEILEVFASYAEVVETA
jgi:response regulator RpfG family c-di-GMP phosphodiesterase